jgi:glycosyltransferase involved in cell wall biosynthesis
MMNGLGGAASGAPRVLLAAPGGLSERGGAAMRWRALHAALSMHGPTEYYPVRCAAPGLTCGHRNWPAPADDPFASSYCQVNSDDLVRHVEQFQPDLVVASELRLHRYAARIREATGVPVVDDMHNVEFALRRGLASQQVSQRYTREHSEQIFDVEAKALEESAGVWVCSEHDRELLLTLHGYHHAPKVRVASNALPVVTAPSTRAEISTVVFTGSLSHEPNVQAARLLVDDITPRLQAAEPGLPVVLAGADCPRWLRRAADTTPGLRVVADPPDLSALIRPGVMIVPLRMGGGTRFKVLEALALCAPVVSTAKGVEGLDLIPDHHYLRAEQPDEFVAAIGRLRADPELTVRLRTRGHEHVQRRFSYQALTDQLGEALTAALGPESADVGARLEPSRTA